MSKKKDDWEVKIENDGIMLLIKYINGDFLSELYYEGKKVCTGKNREAKNFALEEFQLLTPDDKCDYLQNFTRKTTVFQQYINDNKDKISSESQGNAYVIYQFALYLFSVLGLSFTSYLPQIFQNCIDLQEKSHPKILQELMEELQIYYQNGKYKLNKTLQDFIYWCVDENYIDDAKKGVDLLSAKIIFDYIDTDCDIETIKRYIRKAKTKNKTKKK